MLLKDCEIVTDALMMVNVRRLNSFRGGVFIEGIDRAYRVCRAFWNYMDNDRVLSTQFRGYWRIYSWKRSLRGISTVVLTVWRIIRGRISG